MTTATAVIQELRQMADGRYFATHRSSLQTAAETLEQISERLEEWRNLFPGKTPHEVSLLLAAANFLVKANGKLMAENERLNDKTPVIDAAVELCAFCRTNNYPEPHTEAFQRLTQLVDKLDSELRCRGLIAQTIKA